jgi:hypothetical protein
MPSRKWTLKDGEQRCRSPWRSESGQTTDKARRAIDFSTVSACVSHATQWLDACVMISLAVQRTEIER